ncbi:MAG: aldo/keto reductase, partial [Roseateles sp.]
MELALGTVQFGLAYGAVGSGRQVSPDAARAILNQAWFDGVRWLDTAAAYGDIEARLAGLCGAHDFRIVSKIASLAGLPEDEREAALRASIARSVARLGRRLDTLMFHSPADLEGDGGAALWQTARQATQPLGLRLGVSVYGPQELAALREREGYGETSVANLVKGIEARRTIGMDRMIYGLGARDIGETTSTVLARNFDRFEDLQAAAEAAAKGLPGETYLELSTAPGVGPKALDMLIEAGRGGRLADPWP